MPQCRIFQSPIGNIRITCEQAAIVRMEYSAQPLIFSAFDQDPVLDAAENWLARYFSGEAPDPSQLPIQLHGTPFQLAVWEILKTIPYGKNMTYGQIAKQLSPTMSAQAVGNAVGRNPISILIPCHRVLGTGGKLTGYAGGLDRKRFLLELEGIPHTD